MKYSYLQSILLVFLVIQGCQTRLPANQEWTLDEQVARFSNQTHHWGQRGQIEPNNGWSNYAYLKMDFGDDTDLILKQSGGELIAEVQSRSTKSSIVRALSIPGAGIFYSPREENVCRPDLIERLGMYAEAALFYIGTAFPDGPAQITSSSVAKISGAPVELRFMQGVVRMPKRGEIEASVKLLDPLHFLFVVKEQGKQGSMQIEWSGKGSEFVSSDEKLSNWLSCWSGLHSTDANGSESFRTNISDPGKLQSFGDVRRELNSSSHQSEHVD